MEANKKKLIQLRSELKFYKELDKKIDDVLNCKLEIEDWSNDVYIKCDQIENELVNLKTEMDLSDDEWDEDE